jgi:hypothetical protein
MVDIKNKAICQHEDCNIRSSFGSPDDRKPRYCAKHKLDGMVDVISRRCKYEGCPTYPVYGFPNDKKPACCVKHKLDGMVDYG